ncbi:MAG: DapH/DapD/GlmU-related protein [bacterium]
MCSTITENGGQVGLVEAPDSWQVSGINTRRRLLEFEREGYRRQLNKYRSKNITVHDPDRVKIGPWVELAGDNVLEGDVRLTGETKIGRGTVISGSSVVINSELGPDNFVEYSYINRVKTGSSVEIGPYCHLRPGTAVEDDVRLGNFVEVKNSNVKSDTNIAHLSYIGDTDVGGDVNVGAGTITCNYDGYNKHRTVIGDNVFVGSNCELVAPVEIGAGAMIGAGSTVTEDVPPAALAISRAPQENKENWVKENWKPRKEKEKD